MGMSRGNSLNVGCFVPGREVELPSESFGGIPLFSMLKSKMSWHKARQQVLSENVANASTPGYQARDLKPPVFSASTGRSLSGVRVSRTHVAHLDGAVSSGRMSRTDWDVSPKGGGVVLEEQMIKSAENQMDYQLATDLYSKSLGLLRMAARRRG